MRANGARGGVAPPLTATDVEYCCCFVSAADDRRARDRVATLATAEFMVMLCENARTVVDGRCRNMYLSAHDPRYKPGRPSHSQKACVVK